MNNTSIEESILSALYEAWLVSDDGVNLELVREQRGWDKKALDNVEHRLERDGLIRGRSLSTHEITAKGIIHTENASIVSDELKTTHVEAREKLLHALYNLYDKEGPLEESHYTALANEIGLDRDFALKNLEILEDIGYLSHPAVGCFNLSDFGLQKMEEYKEHCRIADEFERISEMQPQPRGRALQSFLAELLQQGGWSQLEGVRTSHEEMDIILFQGREYYLIECKWEKDPIEAGVIRELIGKLGNRAGVQGIAVSMSGFTTGALTQIQEIANSRVVLLFGPEDIRSVVYRKASFESLLDEKYRELVVHKRGFFS